MSAAALGPVGLEAEHHGADLAGADAAELVQRHGERLARVLAAAGCAAGIAARRRTPRARRPAGRSARRAPRASRRCSRWCARGSAGTARRRSRRRPDGDGLEVAPGESAVGRKALGQDQPVARRRGERVVVQRQPAADVGERVLLGAHGHAVGDGEHVAHDVGDRPLALPRLAALDEPGVLGEAAGVDEERLAVAVSDLGRGTDVREAHRLAAARVVGDRQHHQRHAIRRLGQQRFEPREVHVALERMRLVGS